MLKAYIDYIKDNPNHYWFKARCFGWGWTPATREGWGVIFVFLVLLLANGYRFNLFDPKVTEAPLEFWIETVVLFLLLIVICWRTGERPRWQFKIPKRYEK